MSDTTLKASVPALVLVMPKSVGSDSRPVSDFSEHAEEEHDGNVFVGLKFALIIYLVLAVTTASAWKLFHLFS
jgi:hypothetical protein